MQLLVNGQACGTFIGASPCASGLLFVGEERSLIVRGAKAQLLPGKIAVTGTIVDWGRAAERRAS